MRARNIKPSFFTNPDLGECSPVSRLLFAGLWCCADREGRLLDRAKQIKAQVFPYDSVSIDEHLSELEQWGLIERYEVEGLKIISIPKFLKHQRPHVKEKSSELPGKQEEPQPRKVLAPTQVRASTSLGTNEHALNPECGILNPECGILNEEYTSEPGVPSPLVKKSKQEYTTAFQAFWLVYPVRVGKMAAFREWGRAIKVASAEHIIARAAIFAKSDKGSGRFCPHPATWLARHSWDDDESAWCERSSESQDSDEVDNFTPAKPVVRGEPMV